MTRYLLKTKDLGITWKVGSEDKETEFVNTIFGVTHASFAMCPLTCKSHTGYVVFMNHGVISYKSKLQNIVTLSNVESEFVVLSDVTCEVKYLRELSRGLGYPQRDAALVKNKEIKVRRQAPARADRNRGWHQWREAEPRTWAGSDACRS